MENLQKYNSQAVYINLNKDKKKFNLQDIIIHDCIQSCLFHFSIFLATNKITRIRKI